MSGYDGAGASRSNNVLKSWSPRWYSAGSDIDLNLETLRNRAADLSRNTAIGAAAINTSARSTIGSGLKLFPRVNHRQLGISAESAREWNRRAAEEFALWSTTVDCDLCRRNNFGDLQYIAYVSYLTDGDVFCLYRRKAPTARNPYTLRLQLLESNRVSTPTDGGVYTYTPIEGRAANGNRIVSGIEVDDDGELQAIYVSNRVPNDLVGREMITRWARVAAFGESGYPNLLQVAHDIRPGQYRGVPYLSSVIEPLKQVSRYTNAELASAIVKSFFSLFFIQPNQNYDINEMLRNGGEMPEEAELDLKELKLGSGTLNALPRGVDVKTVDSGQSASAFPAFVGKLTQQIGSALGIPAEVLMQSFNSSYSASRAALLQANDEFQQRREWFVRDFCRPIYQVWLEEAIGLGRLKAPGFFEDARMRAAWSECEFYGPTMSSLDPLKEAQAAALRMELGLTTHEREAAEISGADFRQTLEQLKHERQLMGDDGIGSED